MILVPTQSVGTPVRTLRESGMKAIYAGLTTIDEIVRETVVEDEG